MNDAGGMMRRSVVLLASLLLVCVLMAGAVSATNWTDAGNFNTSWYETYSSGNEFLIYDAASLAAFSEKVSVNNTPNGFESKTVKLMADIDLQSYNWTAIGTEGKSFNGTFDGNGHTISNMKIEGNVATGGDDVYYGLFGYIEGGVTNVYSQMSDIYDVSTDQYKATDASTKYTAKVGNFKLVNPVITTNGSWVGAAIGGAKYAYIHDISVGTSSTNGGTITGANSVGGVIGRGIASFVEDCTNYATVISGSNTVNTYNAGGIAGAMRCKVGSNTYCSAIVACINHGSITYTMTTGGVAGICGQTDTNLVICTSKNTGTISVKATTDATEAYSSSVSGILGVTNGANILAKCINTGSISETGDKVMGSINGLYGRPNGISHVIDCENIGSLSGDALYMGGVTAYVSNVGTFPQLTIRSTKSSGTQTNSYLSGITSSYVAGSTSNNNGGILLENIQFSDSSAFQNALIQEGRMVLKGVSVSNAGTAVSLPFIHERVIFEDTSCSLPKQYTVTVDNTPASCSLNLTLPGSVITISGTTSQTASITLCGEKLTITNGATAEAITIAIMNAKDSRITNSGTGFKLGITGSENCTVINSGTITNGLVLISSSKSTVFNEENAVIKNTNSHGISLGASGTSGSNDVLIHNKGSIMSGSSGSQYILYAPEYEVFSLLNYQTGKLISKTGSYYITYGTTANFFSFAHGVWNDNVETTTVQPGRDVPGSFVTSSGSPTINTYNASNITNITIAQPPTKLIYTEGEAFNPFGLKINASYSLDGVALDKEIKLEHRWLMYSTSPLTAGQTTFTISFMGITTNVPITVKAKPQPVPQPVYSSGDGNMENAFRVLFETQGGSYVSPATGLSYGDKITAPVKPVRDGYTFGGWYKDAACTQGWSFSDAIDGDMTLYAKWTGGSAAQQTTAETAAPTAQPTEKQTTAPVQTQSQGTSSATTAAPAATTAAGGQPTLTQAPAPVFGALLGLLAAGVLLRRRE